MIKNVKLAELNISIATVEYMNFKGNFIEYKGLLCNKNCQGKFDKNLNEQFLIHANFITTTITSKFDQRPNDISTEKIILMPIWATKFAL